MHKQPTKQPKKQVKRYGPGYSIAAFSRASGIPYRRVEKAVANGELATVTLAGITRIVESELPRVMAEYGVLAIEAAE